MSGGANGIVEMLARQKVESSKKQDEEEDRLLWSRGTIPSTISLSAGISQVLDELE